MFNFSVIHLKRKKNKKQKENNYISSPEKSKIFTHRIFHSENNQWLNMLKTLPSTIVLKFKKHCT